MKNYILILIASFQIPFLVQAQDSETRSLGDFHELTVSETIKVKLIESDKNEAVISVDNFELEDVMTEINSGELKIHIRNKVTWKMAKNKEINVDLYYKTLDRLCVNSGGQIRGSNMPLSQNMTCRATSGGVIRLKSVVAENIDIKSSSAGKIDIGEIKTGELDVEISSGSKVLLEGEASIANVSGTSGARLEASSLDVEKLKVEGSSGSNIELGNIDKRLRAKASSGARVSYSGNPEDSSHEKSSGGKIMN